MNAVRRHEHGTLLLGDCLYVPEQLRQMEHPAPSLVFGSPPYENARAYGIGFALTGQAWVDWMMARVGACSSWCLGLTAFVVSGRTQDFRWSATPALLLADLHRAGYNLRTPVFFHRVGIPGSGGPDWFRNDTEFVCCVTPPGRLPWSDNTAMGNAPKYAPGGKPSHRKQSGERVNQEPSSAKEYKPPSKANPGNVVSAAEGADLQHYVVGGGQMGHELAHENEAPFPEKLAETFIRSFCPPGGIVMDPFAGSGTTLCVAQALGRRWLGVDIREDQLAVIEKRLADPRYAFGSWLA